MTPTSFITPGHVRAFQVTRPPMPIGHDDLRRHVVANFYPTPPAAIRALLSVEQFAGSIWEPACGDGAIAKVLSATGHEVISTDLYDWGYGDTGIDFLKETKPRARNIITNPPYGRGLADAFVRQALVLTRETGGKVAMLLNIASLCEPRRTPRWLKTPPARLYAIDGIVCWPDPFRPPPKHFLAHRYCWAIWEPGRRSAPTFWWLSARDFE